MFKMHFLFLKKAFAAVMSMYSIDMSSFSGYNAGKRRQFFMSEEKRI